MWLQCFLCSIFLIILLLNDVTMEKDPETNTISLFTTSDYTSRTSMIDSTTNSNSEVGSFAITIEILRVNVPPGIGNAVELVWGRKLDDVNLNITYGVHYGKDGEDISEPKLLTMNESIVINDLEFCTKYNLAISVSNENKINPNNIRSIVTFMDQKAPPENLQVDFEPRELPCLLIKWSTSCTNIGEAIGYVISAFDHESSHYKIVTLPASNRVDFVHHFQAHYGAKFDIKVSTNFPGSKATEAVTYKVPNFLQPYRVRVTSNSEAAAFMIYWKEPYVPYFIDRIYYEVFVYPGFNISSNYEKYYVTRPILIYKGNESMYTFIVGSVSYDGQYRSLFTDPIVADIYGDVHEISL